MKYPKFLLLSCLIFGSCVRPTFYHQSINDIPTRAPNYNLDIRFTGQDPPKAPYFQIMEIHVMEKGNLSRKQIMKRLELEAIREGLDGIIEVETNNFVDEESNLVTILIDLLDEDGETTTTTVHHTEIFGTGIMYLESMDFIGNQPEYEYFYQIDKKTYFPSPFFKVEYKLTGQVHMVYPEKEEALDIYKKYFQYYSDYHLLEHREGWSYKMEGRQLRKRTWRKSNGSIDKKIIPQYNEQHQLVGIKIRHVNSQIHSNEYVQYAYDEQGKLITKNVDVHDGTRVYEEFDYEGNRLVARKIMVNRPGKEPIYLNTSVTYYDPDFLEDYYYNEIAIRKDPQSQ